MIRRLPDPKSSAATVVLGRVDTAAERVRAAIVLKMAFDIQPDGRPLPSHDPARFALRLRDEMQGSALLAEADIAVEKARTDIVVLGWIDADSHAGSVAINGVHWLERAAAANEGDSATHLFGWHGKGESGRALGDRDWVSTGPDDLLPAGYTALFNNFYRRSPRFSAPANNQPLPPGGAVVIREGSGAAEKTFGFYLPASRFHARIRSHCGPCPDTPTRWCLAEEVVLAADTLIVAPQAGQITVLWRGGWDWARHPAASYRAVDIDPGEG